MLLRGLALLVLALAAGSPSAAEVAAATVFASGAVAIVGADGASRPAARGGELFSGETVETGADGRVQLKFRDGASMSLQPATRLRVDDYRYGGGEDRGFFSLLKGGLRTISGLIGKVKREQYRVGTVVATIGIRGTEYSAFLGADGLRVTTVAGLVEVCNQGGCVDVHPGETATAAAPDRKPAVAGGSGVGSGGDILPQLPPPTIQAEPPTAPEAKPVAPATAPTAAPISVDAVGYPGASPRGK